MTVHEQFANLNGSEVSREVLKNIISEAKKQNETEIVYRLSKVLLDNPDSEEFYMELKQYPTALNAPRHKGLYKDALTECGRLKKGWKFEKGSVIKVPTLNKKTKQYEIGLDSKPKHKTEKKTAPKKPREKVEVKEIPFVLNDLPKKYEKVIFNSAYNEIKRYTKYSDVELSNAAVNMLFLLDSKLFELLNFKQGYGRNSNKQEYRNVPVIDRKLLKKDLVNLDKKVLQFLLEKLKEYQYETSWHSYGFNGLNQFEVAKTVRFNIRSVERLLPSGLGAVSVNTDEFKKMSARELRVFTLTYYNDHLKGKTVAIKNALANVEFVTKAGRKILKPIYKEKVAVINHLEELIKNSTYNNWGSRKKTDSPDVLGYLNFKSKVDIDGEKRHVRISIILDRDRKTKLKTFEVGTKPKKNSLPYSETRRKLRAESKLQNKSTKTKPEKQNNKNQTKGLGNPTVQPNSLASKLAQRSNRTVTYYEIDDKNISDFLGKIEKKEKESVVITVTGGQGSMKTRFAFRFMDALAKKYRVGHASIEEHPDSSLYWNKVHEYISEISLHNISNPEISNVNELDKLIQENEVIVIDSFAKMQELERGFEVDKDLRKKYDGKLFLVIFQQTADGKMRGGTKSQYDADIVLFTEKFDNYEENFVYADKNRYQNKTLCDLQYNIFKGKLNEINSTE